MDEIQFSIKLTYDCDSINYTKVYAGNPAGVGEEMLGSQLFDNIERNEIKDSRIYIIHKRVMA